MKMTINKDKNITGNKSSNTSFISLTTCNKDETEELGFVLAKILEPGDLVGFSGELGSGKTTFIRGVVRGLGSSDPVTSPTFTLLHLYKGEYPIFHYDFYRIETAEELHQIGFLDYILGDGIVLVEWPERGEELSPLFSIMITLEFSSGKDNSSKDKSSKYETRLKDNTRIEGNGKSEVGQQDESSENGIGKSKCGQDESCQAESGISKDGEDEMQTRKIIFKFSNQLRAEKFERLVYGELKR